MIGDFITLQGICMDFKKKKQKINVLDDIHLSLSPGELVALTGRSGSGKSTLLYILAGLIKPTAGDYLFENSALNYTAKDLASFRRKHLGFILQGASLIHDKNVYANIALPFQYTGKTAQEVACLVKEAAERLGILDKLKHYPHELSGGEAQRVSLARAIIKKPKLILADEPTTFLDSYHSQIVWDVLKELNELGSTILMVTHDLNLVAQCPRAMVLEHGKIDSIR